MNYFGPTAKAVRVSGMCTLPVNIVNEKIYFILFVWYVFLIIVSVALIVWECFHIICSKLRLATLSRLVKRSPSGSRAVSSSSGNLLKSNPSLWISGQICLQKNKLRGLCPSAADCQEHWHGTIRITAATSLREQWKHPPRPQPSSLSQHPGARAPPENTLQWKGSQRKGALKFPPNLIYFLQYLISAQLNIYLSSLYWAFYKLWKLTYE